MAYKELGAEYWVLGTRLADCLRSTLTGHTPYPEVAILSLWLAVKLPNEFDHVSRRCLGLFQRQEMRCPGHVEKRRLRAQFLLKLHAISGGAIRSFAPCRIRYLVCPGGAHDALSGWLQRPLFRLLPRADQESV